MINMRNKGFTIIELLITIALIASVSVAIGVNVINMQERQKEKEIQDFKEKLERTACTYAEVLGIDAETGIDSISTCNLIKDGYLKKIKIPGTETQLGVNGNVSININWDSSTHEKKCEYNVNQAVSSDLTCEDINIDAYYWNRLLFHRDTQHYAYPNLPDGAVRRLSQLKNVYDIPEIGIYVYIKTTNKHEVCMYYNNHEFCLEPYFWSGTIGIESAEAGEATKNKLKTAMESALGTSAIKCTSNGSGAECYFYDDDNLLCYASYEGLAECISFVSGQCEICYITKDREAKCFCD